MLSGFALVAGVLWIKRAFREEDEETRDDEARGFIFRLASPFVLGIAILLLFDGVVR